MNTDFDFGGNTMCINSKKCVNCTSCVNSYHCTNSYGLYNMKNITNYSIEQYKKYVTLYDKLSNDQKIYIKNITDKINIRKNKYIINTCNYITPINCIVIEEVVNLMIIDYNFPLDVFPKQIIDNIKNNKKFKSGYN